MKHSNHDSDATLRLLIDERDIRSLIHRYATALDGKDWSTLRDCFTSDALVTYETIGDLHGAEAVVATCRQALARMDRTQHLIGNIEARVDGASATCSCYLQAQHVRLGTPGGDQNIIAGRYDDELARTATGWRISRRRLSILWTFGNLAVHDLA